MFTVSTNVVPLQSVLALIFHMADFAFEEIVRLVYHLVLFQRSLGIARSLAFIAIVRFTMHIPDMSFDFLRVIEMFLAVWTCVPYFF